MKDKPTISLTGTATRELANDVLTLTFEVNESGKEPILLQEIMRTKVKEALSVIQPFVNPGVVDVETDSFNVVPQYEYKNGGKQKLLGYVGTASIKVKGTDTATISGLATKVSTMIVSESSNTLSRKVRESVEAELTQEAIKDFKRKAHAAVDGFGLNSWEIGDIAIRLGGGRSPVHGKVMAMAASAGMESSAMSVEGGKTEISATVTGTIIPKS